MEKRFHYGWGRIRMGRLRLCSRLKTGVLGILEVINPRRRERLIEMNNRTNDNKSEGVVA